MRSRARSPVCAGRRGWALWAGALLALLAAACAAPTRGTGRPGVTSAVPAKPSPAPPARKPGPPWYVTVPALSLRGCADLACTQVGVLVRNEAVLRLREDGEWVQVRVVKTGKTGWVAGRFLVNRPVEVPRPSGPAPAPPAPDGAVKEEFLE